MKLYRLDARVLALLILVLCKSAVADNAAVLANRATARNTILEKGLYKHISFLADDSIEGRAAGSRGAQAAAKYLIEQFVAMHLEPAGVDNRFEQAFPGQMRNLLAMIPGSDPELKKEYILIGAHYDHIGYGTPKNSNGPIGYIHHGADDNASGVSSVLELAEAIKQLPVSPKRTIVFALWDGEEVNLLGSKYWLKEPTKELADLKAVINIDMVGRLRDNKLILYGSRTAVGWRKMACQCNRESKLNLDFTWEMKADSDHHPFFQAGIPVIMLHTGLHEDYHRPSDVLDKINFSGLENASRFLFELTVSLADDLPISGFRSASRQETPIVQEKREKALPPMPGRFGVRWSEQNSNADDGLLLSEVSVKTPADKAGLKVGDRILKIDGHEIKGSSQFRHEILTAAKSVEVTYKRNGDKEPRTATAELEGERIRWGISWRVDDAEPDSILVARVISGTPADEQGLKPGDRIYSVNDKHWTDQDSFMALLDQPEAEFLVEREGLFRTVTIKRLGE